MHEGKAFRRRIAVPATMPYIHGMKLAILVVYFFDADTRRLVDIHLDRLARHTHVPFKIYGSATLLAPDDRQYLANKGCVHLVETTTAPNFGTRRASREHAHHLESLREAARRDGATHFATLHPDSFPISDDWFEQILTRFDAGDRFAAPLPCAFTSCLVWPRTFDDLNIPLDLNTASSDHLPSDWTGFGAVFPHTQLDTGTSFLLHAWRHNLPFHAMHLGHGAVLGSGTGQIVHLAGTGRLLIRKDPPGQHRVEEIPASLQRLRNSAQFALRHLPATTRSGIFGLLRPVIMRQRVIEEQPVTKHQQVRALLADPDGYIGELLAADRLIRSPKKDRLHQTTP